MGCQRSWHGGIICGCRWFGLGVTVMIPGVQPGAHIRGVNGPGAAGSSADVDGLG